MPALSRASGVIPGRFSVLGAIGGGLLPLGGERPSVRRLAMDLGVHFNTVGEAYRQLNEEGWLDLRHGRGARVIERRARETASPERVDEYRVRLRPSRL